MRTTRDARTAEGCGGRSPGRAVPRGRGAGGFTLLELLVVMGLLSVLTGMAIGALGRVDPAESAASTIAGERRAAQVTARSQGVPTEVWIRPGVDGAPATVQSLLLRPVVVFGFEPGQRQFDEDLVASISGEDVPGGRFGHGRRASDGDRNAVLRWPAPPRVLDLRDGFVCRLDLRLETKTRATVLRLPPALDLLLDEQGRPIARFRRFAEGDGSTALAQVASPRSLPLHRWCTLDVCCNGTSVWLQLDGVELASASAVGMPQQDGDGVFEVSPAEAPFPGVVDEVRWFVYEQAPAQLLPSELRPAGTFRFAYDLHGDPIAEPVVRFLDEDPR